MPTLAHEGNPKLDDITIAEGEVLSEAVLTIDFVFFGPPTGIPSPATPVISGQSSSCPDVFTTEDDGRPFIPIFYNDPQSGGASTVFTDQGGILGGVAPQYTWMALNVETKPGCCGCAYVPVSMVDIPTMSFSDDQVFPVHDIALGVNVLSTQDTPYVGIANFIEDGSTFDNFTGYVLACNYELGVTKLMKYVHQSLCEEGTILGTYNAVPPTDGLLQLGVLTDPNHASTSDTIWELTVNIKDASNNNLAFDNIQVHDSLMNVEYTFTGRGETFVVNERIKPQINYVFYQEDGTPVYSTKQNILIDEVTQIPSGLVKGHRHNRANVGIVALGNHPLGQDTGTFVGGQNQVFLGGTMIVGADANEFGIRASCDSYSFGTNTLS